MAMIFQADIYCEKCGLAICERLNNEGKKPALFPNSATWESDNYPKDVGADDDHGEADTPQHCACGVKCLEAEQISGFTRVGKLLGTDLTSDGVEYVCDAIKEDPNSFVTRFWREKFSAYDEIAALTDFIDKINSIRNDV